MKNAPPYTKNLYEKDEYIIKNPSLHEEDSSWKVSKIKPLVFKVITEINKKEINLLDVGGGAGVILDVVSTCIETSKNIKVNRFALDLSPGMLEIQKKRNPLLIMALNEDISKTSLSNKEIDLTLMIDLLEHVSNTKDVLEEVKRISKYVIFKVPLEDNIIFRMWNFVNKGKLRSKLVENIGHINVYNINKLRYEIEKHTGQIIDFNYTNVFDYILNSAHYKNKMRTKNKLVHRIAAFVFKISPKWCSVIFSDFVMVLVRCY